MSEVSPAQPPVQKYESPMRVPWEVTNPAAEADLSAVLQKYHLHLPDPLVALRGGGMLAPKSQDLAPGYKSFLTAERSMAVIPVKAETGGKLTDVVHLPTKIEPLRFDANLAAYKQQVGEYVSQHWDTVNGPPPLTQVTAVDQLPDGRYVTIDRYRPYLRGLGKGSGTLGLHELDTERISLDDTRQLVHTLNAIHPPLSDFRSWMAEKGNTIQKESMLHPDNPLTALRGQEWWINPNARMDRLRELTTKAAALQKEFTDIDPAFKPGDALTQMIRNNIAVFPHQDGHTDSPEQAAHLAVVHGTLYPDNIHQSQTPDRSKTFFTVTGGDRAHVGLAAESIDWLVTAAAASPAHQEALISEFLILHPSETDRRGLAMHVLYRTLSEAPWFAHSKNNERQNLAQLAYDILRGNGVWRGVNTPVSL